MIETRRWADTDPEAIAANQQITVYGPDAKVIWQGQALTWAENARGSLSIRRLVNVEDQQFNVEVAAIAEGRWERIEIDGYVYDLDALAEQRAREAETAAQRQHLESLAIKEAENRAGAAAAQRLGMGGIGVPGLAPMPPRAARRAR